MASTPASRPWYREPWPWLLMAGPAIVVVAGIATTILAVTSNDGLVADDYYKQGLGVNRVIARDAQARALGLAAEAQFNEERTRVRVTLGPGAQPNALRLTLVHPTRAGSDQVALLAPIGGNLYEGPVAPPRLAGAWRVRVEDGAGRWRISGTWHPGQAAIALAPG